MADRVRDLLESAEDARRARFVLATVVLAAVLLVVMVVALLAAYAHG